MSFWFGKFIGEMLLPPANLLILGLVGVTTLRRRRRLGIVLVGLSLAGIYLLSTQLIAAFLLRSLQVDYVDPLADQRGQVIVLLGAGTYEDAPEYGGDTVNAFGLVRARYAARLHRVSGKPILVSGGKLAPHLEAEALTLKAALTNELGVPVRWTETASRNTFENALESYRVLAPLGIDTVYLVTHAWHMPRARDAFERAGFRVIPAGTAFVLSGEPSLRHLVPSAGAMRDSYFYFHELLGIVWYRIKFALL